MDPHFDGVIFQTHAAELRRRSARAFPLLAILDVRPEAAYRAGHLPGAVSAPAEALGASLPPGVTPATEVVVAGAGPEDPAVREASRKLKALGVHRVVEFTGGVHAWTEAGFSLEAGEGDRRAA